MNTLVQQVEAILFYKAEPLSVGELARITNSSEGEVRAALTGLRESLSGHGITLLEKDDVVTLGTVPEAAAFIEGLRKEELEKDIGKAGLETLSTILYRGPLTRSEIDYIRGVNSAFIVRHLLVRGLIERIPNPDDARSFLYRPTFELLSHLGVTRVDALPEFDVVKKRIQEFEERTREAPPAAAE